jgi:CubicO group peptidase (beta-lactamase class C family)
MERTMKPVQAYLETCVAEGVFPGAAWAVGGRDILAAGGAGSLGAGLEAADEHSLYDLASLTKLFVTLALMRQLEDGLIRLEDRVDFFLPSFRNSPLGETSLFRLLTHTAPLPGGTMLYRHAHTREDLLEAVRSTGLRRDGRVVYTCEAFILLGEIAAAVDRAGLDELIRARVCAPLGMDETFYRPPPEELHRIAPTEGCPGIRGRVHDENAAVMGGISGNAGLFSSVLDMTRLAAAVLDSLEGRGTFLYRPTALMMTRNATRGRGENRGLGWMLKGPGSAAGDLMPEQSFGHTGFTGTSLWIDPERGLYAILLSNRIHPRRDNGGIFRTRHIFHNLAILHYGGGT